MVREVLSWGLMPLMVTTDAWYGSTDNLKLLKHKKLGFLTGIAKNRQVAIDGSQYTQVQNLVIPDKGLVVHLRGFVKWKCFVAPSKTKSIDTTSCIYQMKMPHLHWQDLNLRKPTLFIGASNVITELLSNCAEFPALWLEQRQAIMTHFFCAIRAFTQLELMRTEELIENWYQVQRTLTLKVAREFILEHLKQKIGSTYT